MKGILSILGAGSWGTALAVSAALAGHRVRLWARRVELADEIRAGSNHRYLPGVPIPPGIEATSRVEEALADASLIILAVPSSAVGEMCGELMKRGVGSDLSVVCVAKGLERGTGRRMSEIMAESLKDSGVERMVLLGPSHAEEVARKMPTAVVLSGGDAAHADLVQRELSTAWFRIYTNDDLVGVETAGALKNILAIATGICDGIGLGDNTKGALLTRGVAEIARLGVEMGGRHETFFGLAGIGDVITTCLSRHSRNRAFGERIGGGETTADALVAIGQVVEGVETLRSAVQLARRHSIEMPISEQVLAVVNGDRDPREAIEELMGRALKAEREFESPSRRQR